MITKLLNKIFGDKNVKEIKKLDPIIDAINNRFNELQTLSEEDFKKLISDIRKEIRGQIGPEEEKVEQLTKKYQEATTEKERDKLSIEIDKQKENLKTVTVDALDDNLIEVYAIIKETCRRLLGHKYDVRGHLTEWDMVPFDVQLIGAIALHQGNIAEMATGEGKTLVATMPLFLNALTGRGVHLVTVNDYLVQRDAEWMKPIFEYHGLTVGTITTGMDPYGRQDAYNCDITYGTNSEFGFDYLRDNMAISPDNLSQRGHFFAIIDEVDSILIDEARTPLIISGPVSESKNFYHDIDPLIKTIITYQNQLILRFLSEIRELQKLEKPNNEDNERLARLLVTVKRGAPKNKAFSKIMQDPDMKKLTQDYEGVLLRDKKMHEIDNDLFFIIEEAHNTADLCEKGRDVVSDKYPNIFEVLQLEDILQKVDEDEQLTPQEKQLKKEELSTKYFDNNEILHDISQLIKAYSLFEKDKDYVVQDNKVVIVDEFTGRMMTGRRFSDGLHQALEAKEKVKIEEATQTYATITLQNYFRMYEKLSGMTGTAVTEEGEFYEIYKLPVKAIPTNLPLTRLDHDDVIYMTKNEKYNAIINEIEYWHTQKKPVLIGTVTVESSETLSRLLQRKKIPHKVLNAKYHQQEAEIVANAGQPGSVTIATNMAGRGTDIKLGSSVITKNKEDYQNIKKEISQEFPFGRPLDGLHIIGTERHESRRIDRQLRGRAGRQGDPGTSRFYLSLEDDLMRLFGSEKIAPLMMKMGLQPGEAIRHPWMSKAVEGAQKRVETQNFEIRKQLIKYDEVMNQQREVIYTYRRNVLKGYDVNNDIQDMIDSTIDNLVSQYIGDIKYVEEWPLDTLLNWFEVNLKFQIPMSEFNLDRLDIEILTDTLKEITKLNYTKREDMLGTDILREIERRCLLEIVDTEWREHLHEMDILKEGISFRAYANKDPLTEYKKESYGLFEELIYRIHENTVKKVFNSYIITNQNIENILANATMKHEDLSALEQAAIKAGMYKAKPNPQEKKHQSEKQKLQPIVANEKIGRNDPCPCGSGKKYKKCCGKPENETYND
jgi:preprotein translocase subunit SecA